MGTSDLGLGHDVRFDCRILGLSAGRMARAADRGKVIVTTPSRSWPAASIALLIGLALGYLMAEIGSSSGEGFEAAATLAVAGGAGHGGAASGAADVPVLRGRALTALAVVALLALSRHRS